jgi:hypothetical protein
VSVGRSGGVSGSRGAANHVGETATVCGTVASANYAAGSRGSPTFLNLGKPYPNHVFTAVIWGSDRPKFGTLFRARPEVILHDPAQLTSK